MQHAMKYERGDLNADFSSVFNVSKERFLGSNYLYFRSSLLPSGFRWECFLIEVASDAVPLQDNSGAPNEQPLSREYT